MTKKEVIPECKIVSFLSYDQLQSMGARRDNKSRRFSLDDGWQ